METRSSSGHIGVEMTEWGPRVVCRVKGQNRHAKRSFKLEYLEKAAERYDIVSIYQYGPGALLNKPQNLTEYLETLEEDETTAEIESFMAPPSKQITPDACVHLRTARRVYKYRVAKLKIRGKIYDLQSATRFLGLQVKPQSGAICGSSNLSADTCRSTLNECALSQSTCSNTTRNTEPS